MKLGNIKLGHRFAGLLAIVIVSFVAFGTISFLGLREVQVNGPLYQRIVQDKDLVADVLPPPAYIIESYLVALQIMAATGAERKALVERLHELQREYITRHEFWAAEQLEPTLKQSLLVEAHEPALAFYKAVFDQLLPALDAGNAAAATAAVEVMQKSYVAHRQAINKVVATASKRATEDESVAKATITTTLAVMLATMLAAIGVVAAVSTLMSRSVTRPLNEALKVAQAVADGDLTRRIVATTTDETGQLLAANGRMVERLRAMIGRMQIASHTVSAESLELHEEVVGLASRTEAQAANLEETAATMEELTSTVRHNSDNARNANAMAIAASAVAAKGGAVVSEVVGTMTAISQSSKKIADIIGVIDGIAFQTNILALNAAVEAARAGEQGRGFAVVATEVRSLAQRSANAAKEIKDLITESSLKVESGANLVGNAGATMGEVVAAVDKLTSIMREITAASQEQSSGLDQIAQAVTQLDDITQQNAGLVHAAVSATEALEGQARSLAESLASFKVDGGISGDLAQAEAVEVIAKVRAAAMAETRGPNVAQLARMVASAR